MTQSTDLVRRIADGIIQQEGMPPEYDNPGNLRGCPWLNPSSPFARITAGFWRPGSRRIGVAGLHHIAALHIAQGNSLNDFIAGHPGVYAGFAPGADGNKPDIYVSNLMKWCGISDKNAPLWNLIL